MSTRAARSSKRKAAEPAKAPAVDKPSQKKSKKKKEAEGEPESCHDLFMREVAVREKQLKKHCIIMEMVDTDEDETTLEQLRALKRVFVPKKVQDYFIKVWSKLDDVGQDEDEEGEEDEEGDTADATMKAFMMIFLGKCLTTKHAQEMQTILTGHVDHVDKSIKSGSWQDAFCRWVATAMAARREPHWWEDTDGPDDALEIYERLRQQWMQLKDRTDQELGGLVCDLPGVSVKDELAQYLQGLADEMKQLDYQVEDVVPKPQVKQQKRVKKTLASLKLKKRKQPEQQQQEEEEEPQEEQEVKRQQVDRKKQRVKKQQAPEGAGKVTAAVAALPNKKQQQGPSAAAVQEEAERVGRGATPIGAKAVEQVEQLTKRQRGVGRKQEVEADVGRMSKGKKQGGSKPAEVKKKPQKRKAGTGK